MLLNASLAFPRSSRRRSLSAGKSSRTCIRLSRSPQTHRSSSRKRKAFAYVDNQQCPVRNCVSRYARFLGRDPESRLVYLAGNALSITRRWPPFLDSFHSLSHWVWTPFLMWALSRDRKGENGWVLPGVAASLASWSAVSFPGASQCPGIHCSRTAMRWVLVFAAARRIAWMLPRFVPWVLDCLYSRHAVAEDGGRSHPRIG